MSHRGWGGLVAAQGAYSGRMGFHSAVHLLHHGAPWRIPVTTVGLCARVDQKLAVEDVRAVQRMWLSSRFVRRCMRSRVHSENPSSQEPSLRCLPLVSTFRSTTRRARQCGSHGLILLWTRTSRGTARSNRTQMMWKTPRRPRALLGGARRCAHPLTPAPTPLPPQPCCTPSPHITPRICLPDRIVFSVQNHPVQPPSVSAQPPSVGAQPPSVDSERTSSAPG